MRLRDVAPQPRPIVRRTRPRSRGATPSIFPTNGGAVARVVGVVLLERSDEGTSQPCDYLRLQGRQSPGDTAPTRLSDAARRVACIRHCCGSSSDTAGGTRRSAACSRALPAVPRGPRPYSPDARVPACTTSGDAAHAASARCEDVLTEPRSAAGRTFRSGPVRENAARDAPPRANLPRKTRAATDWAGERLTLARKNEERVQP